jgi:hypothetical protein
MPLSAPCNAQLKLDPGAAEVELERNKSESLLSHLLSHAIDLTALEQELPSAPGFVILMRTGLGVLRNVHIEDPGFSFNDLGIGLTNISRPSTQGLDLAPAKLEPCLELLEDLVVMPSSSVLGNHA